jgi:hypothetical protein
MYTQEMEFTEMRNIFNTAVLVLLPATLWAGEFGMNNASQHGPSAAMKSRNHSTATWSDYSNPWDYFQPGDYNSRYQMGQYADSLYRKAYGLEVMVLKEFANQKTAEAAQARRETHEIRSAAYQLLENIRFGSHRGDLSTDLGRLENAIEAQWWKVSSNQKVSQHRAEIERLAGRIRTEGGPRLDPLDDLPVEKKNARKQASRGRESTTRIGLSAASR